jgi:hypothetical protein
MRRFFSGGGGTTANNFEYGCGGPRVTMMSNIASPWRNDTAAHRTPEPENMRLPTIRRCARRAVSDVAVVPICLHGRRAEQSQESKRHQRIFARVWKGDRDCNRRSLESSTPRPGIREISANSEHFSLASLRIHNR